MISSGRRQAVSRVSSSSVLRQSDSRMTTRRRARAWASCSLAAFKASASLVTPWPRRPSSRSATTAGAVSLARGLMTSTVAAKDRTACSCGARSAQAAATVAAAASRAPLIEPDRSGFGPRGRHPVDRGVDVQIAVQGAAGGPQPGDPAHRGPPGPGPVEHDPRGEPDRGRPEALVGGGGHKREQLERAGIAGQGPAHGVLIEYADLGAELGEAGVTGELVPSDGLAVGPSRLG